MSANAGTQGKSAAIIRASVAKTARDRQQGRLIKDEDIHHQCVLDKLWGRWKSIQLLNFERCGRERVYRTCKSCGDVEPMTYRCDIKWCPRCQWRIAKRRTEIIAQWASRIRQPKHLVLTQKNFPVLTPTKLARHTKALSALRRRKVWEGVSGGCVTVEVTNEGRGWHLHSHWLLDCRFLDIQQISREWGSLVGQEFGVVAIRDLRDRDYLKEVSKYVVKGSSLAAWPAEQVVEFVSAIKGRRFFFAFGTLADQGPEIRRTVKALKPESKGCDCGCRDFMFEDEHRAVVHQLRKEKR